MKTAAMVKTFIEEVWNNKCFEKMSLFLHSEFKDFSLPPSLPPNENGMIKWILATGNSFEHHSTIEEQVTEGNMSVVKIKMQLKHIGVWRDIEPTGMELSVTGYRMYQVVDDKIIAHWGLIDGQAIENQLKQASHGCKISR